MSTITSVFSPPTASQSSQRTLSRQAERLAVGAILLLFVGLGVWYSLVVPPFETPDEIYHYAFVRHVAQGNGLPVQRAEGEDPWEQEGSQAPLYYLLVGWLTAGIDQADFAQINTINPRANIGDPLFPGNKNLMLYSAVSRPLQGANLALHVGRWFSLLLGVVTLWCTYRTAQLAFAHSRWLPLLTLLLVALIPQFIFISASLSNDSMIIATSALVVYWLARMLARPSHESPANPSAATNQKFSRGEWVVLGVLLGLAALSKLQGLGLFVLSGLTVLLLAWTQRDWRLPLRLLLPVAIPALLIAGWWYWRNMMLYGDWSGLGHLLAKNGQRGDDLTAAGLWQEFRGLRYSFWGLFGWFSILLPVWIYTVLDMLTLGALAGLGWRMLRHRALGQTLRNQPQQRIRLLLVAWAFLSLLLLFYWISQASGSQGRLLFPAIGVIGILFVLGLQTWLRHLPARWQWLVWLLTPLLLLGASLFALSIRLPASYHASQPVTTIPETAQRVDVVYGDQDLLTLLAIETPDTRFQPGDRVPITLYMQAEAKPQDDYQLFIQFLDETGTEVGNLTTHPGWGRNPTRLWWPGAIYADTYPVLIEQAIDQRSPLSARVYVGFVDPKTEQSGRFPVPARQAGELIDPFLARIAISPLTQPQLDAYALAPMATDFGNVIRLVGVRYDSEITIAATSVLSVTLLWEAIGTPATDYTAYVHLRDASGAFATGFDQAPAAARFPTHDWRTGDRILGELSVPLPATLTPGDYKIWVGLYETESQGALRLPITAQGERTTGDGEVLVGTINIR